MNFYTLGQDVDGLNPNGSIRCDLPNVLLIGDSISIGYTEPVRICLKDVCNICRTATNCGDTRNGLANIDSWLGPQTWDLIHFNWGLHDLCYRHPKATVYGNRDKVNGTLSVESEIYKANLEQLVRTMLPKTKRLLWATTTYVPEGEVGRHQGDEVRYNALAAEVMEKHGIPIDDLYSVTQAFPPSMFTCPRDVHYTKEGYVQIAKAVSESIREQLTSQIQRAR